MLTFPSDYRLGVVLVVWGSQVNSRDTLGGTQPCFRAEDRQMIPTTEANNVALIKERAKERVICRERENKNPQMKRKKQMPVVRK